MYLPIKGHLQDSMIFLSEKTCSCCCVAEMCAFGKHFNAKTRLGSYEICVQNKIQIKRGSSKAPVIDFIYLISWPAQEIACIINKWSSIVHDWLPGLVRHDQIHRRPVLPRTLNRPVSTWRNHSHHVSDTFLCQGSGLARSMIAASWNSQPHQICHASSKSGSTL